MTFQVHNESIVVPETIDCIRALTGIEPDGAKSIAKTDASMGMTKTFLPATTRPVAHVTGAEVPHPAIEAQHAEFMTVGFKGAEDPAEPEPTSAQGR